MPLLYNLYVQGHYIKGEEVPQWHENRKMAAIGDMAIIRGKATIGDMATARDRHYYIRLVPVLRV